MPSLPQTAALFVLEEWAIPAGTFAVRTYHVAEVLRLAVDLQCPPERSDVTKTGSNCRGIVLEERDKDRVWNIEGESRDSLIFIEHYLRIPWAPPYILYHHSNVIRVRAQDVAEEFAKDGLEEEVGGDREEQWG